MCVCVCVWWLSIAWLCSDWSPCPPGHLKLARSAVQGCRFLSVGILWIPYVFSTYTHIQTHTHMHWHECTHTHTYRHTLTCTDMNAHTRASTPFSSPSSTVLPNTLWIVDALLLLTTRWGYTTGLFFKSNIWMLTQHWGVFKLSTLFAESLLQIDALHIDISWNLTVLLLS